jgi:hypothetical protein
MLTIEVDTSTISVHVLDATTQLSLLLRKIPGGDHDLAKNMSMPALGLLGDPMTAAMRALGMS